MPTLRQVSYTSNQKYRLPLASPTPAIDLCACASPSVWFPSPPPISGRLTRQHLVAVTLRNVYCYPLFGAPFFPQNLPHFCWEACLKPTNLENSSDIITTLSQSLGPHISPHLICVCPQTVLIVFTPVYGKRVGSYAVAVPSPCHCLSREGRRGAAFKITPTEEVCAVKV